MYTDLGDDLGTFVNAVKKEIDKLRTTENQKINFVQLGAGDGIDTCDIVNKVMNVDDFGILVEPHPTTFSLLKKNKPIDKYINYQFHQFAVVPDKFFDLRLKFKIQVDKYETSGYPPGNNLLIGDTRHGCTFVESECEVITLSRFVTEYINFPVDCLMLDIEGLDNDVVVEYVTKFTKPSIICFELWEDYVFEHIDMNISKREEVLTVLEKHNYKIFKSNDDFCAILNN